MPKHLLEKALQFCRTMLNDFSRFAMLDFAKLLAYLNVWVMCLSV